MLVAGGFRDTENSGDVALAHRIVFIEQPENIVRTRTDSFGFFLDHPHSGETSTVTVFSVLIMIQYNYFVKMSVDTIYFLLTVENLQKILPSSVFIRKTRRSASTFPERRLGVRHVFSGSSGTGGISPGIRHEKRRFVLHAPPSFPVLNDDFASFERIVKIRDVHRNDHHNRFRIIVTEPHDLDADFPGFSVISDGLPDPFG